MFTRFFGKPKQETNALALASLEQLTETLETLDKREKLYMKKAAAEVEKAKGFINAKNKIAAKYCLMQKKRYEQEIEKLGNLQLRIHDQMIMIEASKSTVDTVDALRSGAAAMKAMQKATNIDDVDKTMDEINEQTQNMKQIQEALSNPIGAEFDEDELLEELTALEDDMIADEESMDKVVQQPAKNAPAISIDVPSKQRPPVRQKNIAEDKELAALLDEMAL